MEKLVHCIDFVDYYLTVNGEIYHSQKTVNVEIYFLYMIQLFIIVINFGVFN